MTHTQTQYCVEHGFFLWILKMSGRSRKRGVLVVIVMCWNLLHFYL